MSQRHSRIARNILSNYAATIVGGLIFVVLTPYVIGSLGLVGYGVWVLIGAIGFFVNYLDFGLDDAQLKYLAEFDGNNDTASINRLLGTSLSIHTMIGLVACTLMLLLAALPAEQLFNVPEESAREFKIVLVLLGINLLLGFPASVIEGVFEGFQRFDIANGLEVAFAIIGAVLTVIVLESGYGLVGLASLDIGLTIAGACADLVVIRRLFPDVRLGRLLIDRQIWQKLKSFGTWSFLDDLLTEGSAHLDKLILPIVLSVSLLTPYSLVMALAALVLFVSEPITDVFFPKSSALHARSEFAELRRLWCDGTRAVIAVAAPTAIVVLIFGDAILDAWVGAEYAALPALALPLLVLNLYVSALFWPATTILMGIGHVRKVFWFSVIEVGIGLTAVLVLAPRFGIVGFITGMLIANVLAGCLLAAPAAARALSQTLLPFILNSLAKPMFACLPSVAAAYAINRLISPTSIVELGTAVIGVVVVHVASYSMLAMSRDERSWCVAELRHSFTPRA